MESARTILQNFTDANLPDLDVVTLGALELLQEASLPAVPVHEFTEPLVVGSGNAMAAGQMLFSGTRARFADESAFEMILNTNSTIDAVFIISASGSKHAVTIAESATAKGLPVFLLTNNPKAPAAEVLEPERVIVFPKNREPYSYNTSTYLSLLQSVTHEDIGAIQNHIASVVQPLLETTPLKASAYTFILPPAYGAVCSMVRVKFDELFGPMVVGRAFTSEEVKHAKTIIENGNELFITLGVENHHYGVTHRRLTIPIPEQAHYVALIAIAYFVVGHIQRMHPPYFKEHIARYIAQLSEVFGRPFNTIVE